MTWWTSGLGIWLLVEIALRAYRSLRHGIPFWSSWRMPSVKPLSFMSHPYALYVKKPNCDGLYPSNSLGYVGKREATKGRRPNSIRIYCVGGSTVEDHDPAQGPDSSWPAKLQDLLAGWFPETAIECINAGTAGYTSAESLTEFLFRGLDLAPDLVLVYHNVNDAWTCQMLEGFTSDYSHARRHKPWKTGWVNRIPQVPVLWTYQLLRDWATRRFGRANALLFWISDPPWRAATTLNSEAVRTFQRNITNLAVVAHAWGCVPVLIKWECDWSAKFLPSYLERRPETFELYAAYLQANNEVLEQVAAQLGYCHYLEPGPFEPAHFSDSIHFSAMGLEAMACRVADGIEPLIRSILENRKGIQAGRTGRAACVQAGSGKGAQA